VKFKLVENIGRRGSELLRAAGHDVMTVRDQGLGGASDESLFATCANEGRALVTLDHDFGQVTRFPPERSAGLVILEAGPRVTSSAISNRLRDFLAVLETRSVVGSLWIVELGRVRIHLRDADERAGGNACGAAVRWPNKGHGVSVIRPAQRIAR